MTLEKKISQEIAEWEELSRLHKITMTRKENVILEDSNRNLMIIGGYVAQLFPEVEDFQPQKTEDENNKEYAPLCCFLTLLKSKRAYLNYLIHLVERKYPLEN